MSLTKMLALFFTCCLLALFYSTFFHIVSLLLDLYCSLFFIRVLLLFLYLSMKYSQLVLWAFVLSIVSASECLYNNPSQQHLVTMTPQCFNKNYSPDSHDGHKLSQIIQVRLQKYRSLLQHLRMHKVKHIQTTPVIKWAQNKQKIFINFKLSHRQDSPPCSDIRHQKFRIQNIEEVDTKFVVNVHKDETKNISSFDFQSECFFTVQKFMFRLNVSFNATVKGISIDREGFGSYTVVVEKGESGIWIDPFEDVHRAAIWQQMRHRFESEMNEYFQMRQKRMQQKQQSHKKKKKKRPSPKQPQDNKPQQQL